jgi:hypothetical protein
MATTQASFPGGDDERLALFRPVAPVATQTCAVAAAIRQRIGFVARCTRSSRAKT